MNMNWVTQTIAIADYVEAHNVELLRQAGIQSVLRVA